MASDSPRTKPAARKLAAADLMNLEQYARERDAFRARVIEHKRRRTVPIGPNMTWVFEDRLTIQYQVQEMLRIERIFEAEGIQQELDAYNPLIPDGSNWKVTMMIEYPDPRERARALADLRGVESQCYMDILGSGRVVGIADEDLERANEDKTSAVHWLRFELPAPMRAAVAAGGAVVAGTDHPHYRHSSRLEPRMIEALARDLD
jgi:Protein of unknown function (DUF3501)